MKNITVAILSIMLSSILFSVFAAKDKAPIINKFGLPGLYYSHSAKTLGMGRLSAGTYFNVSRNKKYLVSVVDEKDLKWSDKYDPELTVGNFNFFVGYGIIEYLDVSFMLPLYFDHISEHNPYGTKNFGGDTKGGFGDLELSIKWQYPPYPHKTFFEMAYFGAICFSTGSEIEAYFPRKTYYIYKDSDKGDVKHFFTSGIPEYDMKMLWSFDFDQLSGGVPVEAHVNYGVRWTERNLDHLFLLNIGMSYHPFTFLSIFSEFSGETRIDNVDRGFKIGDDPLRLCSAVRVTPPWGMFLTMGIDINISSDTNIIYHSNGKIFTTYIEPRTRFSVSMGWTGHIFTPDKDKDGIKDNDDKCPRIPEDFDNFEDTDGCPDYDNDEDNIPDSTDKCINDKEDFDQFEDEDGCPDYDNDKDGIPDLQDRCPNIAEDFDGFEDDDGCPDYDNDKDGIPDSSDRCIDKPEDIDGFEDKDGCPDYDNDMDGIPDSLDKCINEPETINGYKDLDGCPDKRQAKAKEIKRGRVILRGVNFESGKAILTTDSYTILDKVYASLVEWPEIQIEIRGHTDSVGGNAYNKHLSQKRAESVLNYLMNRGVSYTRLKARGMGEDEPIADNSTANGRSLNRRVELHRID